LKFIEKVNFK